MPELGDMPIPYPHPRIRLESLCFLSRVDRNWIAALLSPFDLSGVIALSVSDSGLLQQRPIVESLPSLKILEDLFSDEQRIDFALMPQLEVLRITLGNRTNSVAYGTLASIRPTCRLRDIVINIARHGVPGLFGEEWDLALSRLPLAHQYTVTFQMNQSDYDAQPGFTRLRSLNILRRGEIDSNWFKNLTRTFH
ncbi:hypothetical protein C8R46DRAFT_1088192 [Mycena filopes]|nr:hypothetical protein C8R46DRAFT_1088192 [Mycena filopes]